MLTKEIRNVPSSDQNSGFHVPLHRIAKAIAAMTSDRQPRDIVTRKGRRARGPIPSRKAPKHLQYESLVEEAVLHVLEVATLPKVLNTQPRVITLQSDKKPFRYTPDVEVETETMCFFVEIKDNSILADKAAALELREIIELMRQGGLLLVPILERDVKQNGLLDELRELNRLRPAPGRYRDDIDASLWDPLGRIQPPEDIKKRWEEAKRLCDELLQRVMRRDPDDLFPIINQ
ncbi:hypothetical protein [Chromobacterium haemolyticum]